MTKDEFIHTCYDHDAKSLVVRNRVGNDVEVNIDTVEEAYQEDGDTYVWGGYWKKVPGHSRPVYKHKWFWLSNVTFVKAGFL